MPLADDTQPGETPPTATPHATAVPAASAQPTPRGPDTTSAKASSLLLLVVLATLSLLIVSWVAVAILRRRRSTLMAARPRAPRTRIKNPWREAGRRLDPDALPPEPPRHPDDQPHQ